jgi:hypothetical protein
MRLPSLAVSLVVLACAAPGIALAQEVPARWGSYAVELVDDSGQVLPSFEHRGRSYVLGALGRRYLVRVRNDSGQRAEVVVSVDGRDVVDGRPASLEKRGYIVDAHGQLTIDGYRLSEASVAAFRFSSVPRSYAARKGDARDIGVIGVAVFPERAPRHASPYPLPDPSLSAAPNGKGERMQSEAAPGASRENLSDAAPSQPPVASRELRRDRRPGLGTEFGEERHSPVVRVSFERASARPDAVLTLRYDDRPGLVALGIDVDRDRWARRDETWLRETANPFRGDSYCEPPAGWRAR